MTSTRKLPPIHPGEILKETLDDLGISMNRLAQALHVPANRISSVVADQRGITGETALVTVQIPMVVDFGEGGGWALAGAGDGSEPQSVSS